MWVLLKEIKCSCWTEKHGEASDAWGLRSSLIREGSVFVQAGKSRCDSCGGGRVRTGPLSVESAVKVIHVICKSKVFHRVGGFGFAASDHLKAFPD